MKHDLIIVDSEGNCCQKDASFMHRLVMQYIGTPQGKQKLAASMIQPLRTQMNYAGIARSVFSVSPVNKPTKSFKHKIIGIDSDGECRDLRLIKFPLFEAFSNQIIHIADVKARRFNLIDRHVPQKPIRLFRHNKIVIGSNGEVGIKKEYSIYQHLISKACQEIMAQEDAAVFKALDELFK